MNSSISNSVFTFEAEPFTFVSPRQREATWDVADSEGEVTAKAACPGYEKGEVELSHCQEGPCRHGHLMADVTRHPRGLLIADFGVDWHGLKAATKSEKLLQQWMNEIRSDLHSVILRIYGYSDCAGVAEKNFKLRRARAQRVRDFLGKDLQSRVDFTGEAPPGEYISDNTTRAGRAKNRGVIIEVLRLPEQIIHVRGKAPPVPCVGPGCKPPPPPPKPPQPCVGPGCKPPPPPPPGRDPKPPSTPWTWPWFPPGVTTAPPPDDGSPNSWVWPALSTAATFLGVSISIGMRSLSKADLATALDAAWLVFQLEQGGIRAVIGLAGEAAAEAIIARVIGADAARIFNLNRLAKSFPVVDLVAPTGVFSVKTKGLLSTKVGKVLDAALVQEYTQDLIDLAVGDHPLAKRKLAKAAQLLFDHRIALQKRGAWPTTFKPGNVSEVEKFIRGKAKLLVPHDHVQLLRRHIGSALNARLQQGLRLPPGTNPVKWVNSFVDRIDSIGILTSDLDIMLEAARKYLPKEQVERLQREANAIRKLKRK